jgi:hypothetical protein
MTTGVESPDIVAGEPLAQVLGLFCTASVLARRDLGPASPSRFHPMGLPVAPKRELRSSAPQPPPHRSGDTSCSGPLRRYLGNIVNSAARSHPWTGSAFAPGSLVRAPVASKATSPIPNHGLDTGPGALTNALHRVLREASASPANTSGATAPLRRSLQLPSGSTLHGAVLTLVRDGGTIGCQAGSARVWTRRSHRVSAAPAIRRGGRRLHGGCRRSPLLQAGELCLVELCGRIRQRFRAMGHMATSHIAMRRVVRARVAVRRGCRRGCVVGRGRRGDIIRS